MNEVTIRKEWSPQNAQWWYGLYIGHDAWFGDREWAERHAAHYGVTIDHEEA